MVAIKKNTQTIQNITERLLIDMVFELPNQTPKMKAQYAKIKKSFIDLNHNLDVLNDMIEQD